jgi:hypothetical protein
MQRTNGGDWRAQRRQRIAQQQQDRTRARMETEEEGARGQAVRPRRSHLDRIPVVLIGWAILAAWWAAGGRYTIDGTPLLLNEIARFFHLSARLGAITEPAWYLRLCWLPIAMSIIERRNRPRSGLAWNISTVYTIGIWAIVAGADFGSTWLAITHPDPDAWPIALQVAQIAPLALLLTAATTFAPEIGFVALWRYLRS